MKLNEISIAVKIQLKVDSSINENPWDFSYLEAYKPHRQLVVTPRMFGRVKNTLELEYPELTGAIGLEPFQNCLLELLRKREQETLKMMWVPPARLGKSFYKPVFPHLLKDSAVCATFVDAGV